MSKRKINEVEEKEDFAKIAQLDDKYKAKFKKFRKDLQESIERTARINKAFVRELNKKSSVSDQVNQIIHQLEELNYYIDIQRNIVDKKISDIIDPTLKDNK